MNIPNTKIKRAFTGGKTAIKMGGNALKYISKKPFLTREKNETEKSKLHFDNAALLFAGLSQLKGTALKIAQLLCLELELLPDEYRNELEKSCYQVPPMNQAMVLKILKNEYENKHEKRFDSFDTIAFAAASLGQVHRATKGDKVFAVKLQYPSIKETIDHDIQIIRQVTKPMKEYNLIKPALKEIRARLLEETNYLQEAKNQKFFIENHSDSFTIIPKIYKKYSTEHILCSEFIDGTPLIEWVNTPAAENQEVKNNIAQALFDFFIYCCYDLNTIHADPNPGNFIVTPDHRLAVIDFGCVKKLDPDFMAQYKKIPGYVLANNRNGYINTLENLGLFKSKTSEEIKDKIFSTVYGMSDWLCKPFEEEYFDFKANPDFMAVGKDYSEHFFEFTQHVEMNPEFLFLERTRHGLFRIFEKLQAKVKLQNAYEWNV